MNPSVIKHLLVLAIVLVMAVVFGYLLASGDYTMLFLAAYAGLMLYVLVFPGYIPLIALGLLSPFVLPIPYISNFPFLLLILGICCVKFFFEHALSEKQRVVKHCITVGIVLFFAWVLFRYCKNPVMPNVKGFGANVTGFRSYLNYAMCLIMVFLIPYFVTNRQDVKELLKWLCKVSIFFIFLMTPFVFSKSPTAAYWISLFGVNVSFYDNGWLRFVALPSFGIVLISLAILPEATGWSKWKRTFLFLLGAMAIFLGGNRGSFAQVLAIIVAVQLYRRQYFKFAVSCVGIAFILISFYYIGERLDLSRGVGFMRVLSIVSRRVAEASGAVDTSDWRIMRWRRAMNEIAANPLFGKGYGGVENAWVFADVSQFEDARLEVDLATGGIHNGYISCAYSLGIPALILFLFVFIEKLWITFKFAERFKDSDKELSELYIWVGSNLVGLTLAIYVGADLNAPIIWLFIAMAVYLKRMAEAEEKAKVVVPSVVPSGESGGMQEEPQPVG
ncbi:MAG: O-antigen ligase family protein [Verrucomicrobiae bacterium]|nr:O-antigen ligase family protein [Verrucomicrobiae bacterium]